MAPFQFDFNPADHITVGAIGVPGSRTFFLQAGRGIEFISLLCEKEQMRALGEGLLSLLEQIEETYHRSSVEAEEGGDGDDELVEPVIPMWRIAQLGVGYDEANDRIVILAQELIDEDEEPAPLPGVGRLVISRGRARALAYHTLDVVAAGRPACPFCGEPLTSTGHFCPRTNGHGKTYVQ